MNPLRAIRPAARVPSRSQLLIVVVVALAAVAIGVALALPSRPPGRSSSLIVAMPSFGVEALDPSADYQAGHRYYGHLFDYLLSADSRPSPRTDRGALASWSAGDDGTSYTLHLRPGLRWHGGSEAGADDLRYSIEHYERAAAACADCGELADSIVEMRGVDRYALKVTLDGPNLNFIQRLGPDHEDVPLLPLGGPLIGATPVGSGPWKYAGRRQGESMTFHANRSYWDRQRVPHFDRLALLLVPDPSARIALLRSGGAEIVQVEPSSISTLKAEGYSIDGPRNVVETALRFFMSHDPSFLTSRADFREALITGADLTGAVERLFPREAATPATGSTMFTPSVDGFDGALPRYRFDPDRARRLLESAGYSGETVSLLSIPVYDMPEIPGLNGLIVDDWRRIGIKVAVIPATYVDVKARFLARPQSFSDLGPAPVFHGGHVNRPGGIVNAVHRYLTSAGESLMTYHNPADGDRIFEGLAGMPAGQSRTATLLALNRRLHSEFWSSPVMWRHETWALSPRLGGWRPADGMGAHLNFETVKPTR